MPDSSHKKGNGAPHPSTAPASPLVSCYAYSGGYHWHWKQSHDSFPGQPVVLIHGLIVTSMTLVPLAEAITGWAPVLVPDLPGFGLSSGDSRALGIPELAAALAEWMSLVGVPVAHVVGSSFGSQIAAELAARFPQRIRSLTLIGPTVDPSARTLRAQAARFFEDVPHEPLRLWADHAHNRFHHTFDAFRALLRDRIETKLPHVKAPALILRGSCDPIAPESWTRHAARLLPGARADSLSDGAHCVHFSHPRLVASAVRKFTFPLRHGLRL